MASFIDFEISVDDEDKDKDNEVSDNSDAKPLLSFIECINKQCEFLLII